MICTGRSEADSAVDWWRRWWHCHWSWCVLFIPSCDNRFQCFLPVRLVKEVS